MKLKYILWSLLGVLVLATIVALAVLKPFAKKPQYDLYNVTPSTVSETVSVSGSITTTDKVELGFLTPGIVRDVKVKVGQLVKTGDTLVVLDTDILGSQAAQAKAQVTAAQALVDKLQNSLRGEDRNVLDQSLNNARTALNSAQIAYQNAYNLYQSNQSNIGQSATLAKMAMDNAYNAFTNAQNNYQTTLNRYSVGQATSLELSQAQSALQSATSAYNTARAQYDSANSQTGSERISAKAQLDSAAAALASAQSAYNLAEAQHRQALAPANSADLTQAQAQVASARAALSAIGAQISKSTLKAPIAGTVTVVNAKKGQLAGSQTVVTLETTSDFKVEAYVSEVDIRKIQLGQTVNLSFDSLNNQTTTGNIIGIDPSATILTGAINYKITVSIQDKISGLKPSMTADLDIMTENKDNVLAVPRRALSKVDDKYQVKILVDEKEETKNVEVGLIGDTNAEIIAGLQPNDQVILGKK